MLVHFPVNLVILEKFDLEQDILIWTYGVIDVGMNGLF